MASLFCSEHGEKHKKSIIGIYKNKEDEDGGGTIITKGQLIRSCRCDSCNKILNECDTAYFFNFLTEEMVSEFGSYEFGYEREFFNLDSDKDEIELCGFEHYPYDTIIL